MDKSMGRTHKISAHSGFAKAILGMEIGRLYTFYGYFNAPTRQRHIELLSLVPQWGGPTQRSAAESAAP